MVQDITRAAGNIRDAALWLGVCRGVCESWLWGLRNPTDGAIKAIWMVWAACYHPEQISTVFDVATWGKFRSGSARQPPKGQRTRPKAKLKR